MASNRMQNHNAYSEGCVDPESIFNSHLRTVNLGVKRCASDAGLDRETGLSDDENEFLLRNNVHLTASNDNMSHRQRQCNVVDQSQLKNALPNGKKTKGRVKIKMEFIDNKLRRYTTFSKRKTGIMKKAYELSTLTGTQVMLLVASETGHVYTFATRKLQPMITSDAGKALIQTCLNSPDPPSASHQQQDQRMSATGYEEPELSYAVAEEDHKSPQLPDEYLNGSSSCSGSESSLPGSPSSPMPSTTSCTAISSIQTNNTLSSGGTLMMEHSGNSSGTIYGNNRGVIFTPQASFTDKTTASPSSSIFLKIPSALNNLSQNEGFPSSNLMSLPLELTSGHFDEAMPSNAAFPTNLTKGGQCLPTDLSLPIKRESET